MHCNVSVIFTAFGTTVKPNFLATRGTNGEFWLSLVILLIFFLGAGEVIFWHVVFTGMLSSKLSVFNFLISSYVSCSRVAWHALGFCV